VIGARRLGPYLVLPLLAVSLAACSSSSSGGTDPSALTGGVWHLSAESMSALVPSVPSGAEVTIEFKDGEVSGTSACNAYGASYTAGNDGSMRFGTFRSTLMVCEPSLDALERAYVAALDAVSRFSVGDVLSLTGSGTPLNFSRAAAPAVSLTGTEWDLKAVGADASVASVVTRATLLLADDGTASGSAGCNTFHGTYHTSGNALTFGPLATTRKLCEDDVMSLEHAYLTALGKAATYSISGTVLTIDDASGKQFLQYSTPAG
jgi:heat shock protein HslJ